MINVLWFPKSEAYEEFQFRELKEQMEKEMEKIEGIKLEEINWDYWFAGGKGDMEFTLERGAMTGISDRPAVVLSASSHSKIIFQQK